ncbi:MAG: tRNA glutamyl-Q(34) synthetase GluQRS [Limisphaerales bacterium]
MNNPAAIPVSLENVAGAYRGRLAPSPTGFLHLGHARSFWIAQQRARARGGVLVLRNEDLDRARCKPEFVGAMLEDLRWFGFQWQEGPDVGGAFAPYSQSERFGLYADAFATLRRGGFVYPCVCSRQDVLRSARAPHAGEDEPIYPGTCRPVAARHESAAPDNGANAARINWRFRVSDGEAVQFVDGFFGEQSFVAGKDFGDFVVWRHDDVPAYQLAVVVDDALMRITEVVRGEDLLRSTARQLLLYRALGWPAPHFFHCPLLRDDAGLRLAKRHDSLSLRAFRAQGAKPEALREGWKELAEQGPRTQILDKQA